MDSGGRGLLRFASAVDSSVILWTLRGYSHPEGEFEGGEIVCAIERSEDSYRLRVEHDGEIQIHESHAAIETARGNAEMLKADRMARGFTTV